MYNDHIFLPLDGEGVYTWATKPVASASTNKQILITDVGNGGSFWRSNGTDWFPVGGMVVLACSGAAAANTGDTTENTKATVTIPAGIMGTNGAIEVIPLFDWTNNGNTKTVRVKFGGSVVYSIATTATTSCQMMYIVRNANSASAQIAQASNGTSGTGAVVASLLTGTIDTTAATTITITAQCANAADTITLRGYTVRLLK